MTEGTTETTRTPDTGGTEEDYVKTIFTHFMDRLFERIMNNFLCNLRLFVLGLTNLGIYTISLCFFYAFFITFKQFLNL